MNIDKINLGKQGENLAIEFLIKNHWKILHKNWRFKKGEIDIIALKNKTISFIEVKTRSLDIFIKPFEAVNFKKQKQIISIAQAYIENFNIHFETRFDIISIIKNNSGIKLEFIENAFYPNW